VATKEDVASGAGSIGDTGKSSDTNVFCQSSIVDPVRNGSVELPVNHVRIACYIICLRSAVNKKHRF